VVLACLKPFAIDVPEQLLLPTYLPIGSFLPGIRPGECSPERRSTPGIYPQYYPWFSIMQELCIE
jgi:hypothetical protein